MIWLSWKPMACQLKKQTKRPVSPGLCGCIRRRLKKNSHECILQCRCDDDNLLGDDQYIIHSRNDGWRPWFSTINSGLNNDISLLNAENVTAQKRNVIRATKTLYVTTLYWPTAIALFIDTLFIDTSLGPSCIKRKSMLYYPWIQW